MRNTFILFIFFLTIMTSVARAQYITTIAGTGTPSFSGDGGPAILATFNHPTDITADTAGNLYVYDWVNRRIRKINPGGITSTIAGNGTYGITGDGGPATDAEISQGGIATDQAGNIYLSENNYTIRKISAATGIITTIAGTGTLGFTGEGGPATAAEINPGRYIAVDTAGNVYLDDDSGTVVRKIDTAGIITTVAGNGTFGYSGDGGPATAAMLGLVGPITTDRAGNLYITDQTNARIRRVDAAGIITTIAGNGTSGYSGDGGPAIAAAISAGIGICTDKNMNIYITIQSYPGHPFFPVIRKIDAAGIITTFTGTGVAGFSGDGGLAVNAEMQNIAGLTAGKGGDIYFCDEGNQRIRKISTRPYFTNGDEQAASSCGTLYDLDTLLAAVDTNAGNTEIWSLVAGPYHGAAAVADTMLSTGGLLIPSGLSYTPTTGFTGTDTVRVAISDVLIADTTTIYITVLPALSPGIITGADSVCVADSVLLADTASGGLWSVSNANAAIGTAGMLQGLAAGVDTVIYTVGSNTCPAVTTSFTVTVNVCSNGVRIVVANEGLHVYPNPNDGAFTLLSPSAGRVTVTNVMGEVVKELHVAANKETSVSLDVAAGVYFVTVAGNGRYNGKIVVER